MSPTSLLDHIAGAPARMRARCAPFSAEQFNLDLGDEAFIDEFAGGGGASEGYHLATGRHVTIACNHNAEACAMHAMNHPHTLHFCQSVWELDPLYVLSLLNGRKIGGAWFSPDCRHHSRASGGALLDRRIRGLAWVLRKWFGRGGGRHKNGSRGPACPRVAFLENVEEFKTWGPLIAKRDPKTRRVVKRDGTIAAPGEVVPYHEQHLVPDRKRAGLYFQRLLRYISELGGNAETREIRSYVHGAPTIRKRLYMILRFDGRPVVWPEDRFGAPGSTPVKVQKQKPWPVIADCLDFSLPCHSIFLAGAEAKRVKCKRPLTKATLARLAKGIKRHVLDAQEPFIVSVTHQGGRRTEAVREPARTITGANRGEKALVAPLLALSRSALLVNPAVERGRRAITTDGHHVPAGTHIAPLMTEHANQKHERNFRIDEPMRTQCAQVKGGHFAIVAPYMVPRYGERTGQKPRSRSVDSSGPVVVPTGNGDSLAAVFMAQHNGGEVGHQSYGHSVASPASTISGKGCQQQVVAASIVKYYGTDQDPRLDEPCHTVTTVDRFALGQSDCVTSPLTEDQVAGARRVAAFLRSHGVDFEGEFVTVGDYVMIDIGMRMLTPRELFRAQGFPEGYIIDRGILIDQNGSRSEVKLTKTAQVRMCGNSVSPPVACALIAANVPEMIAPGWRTPELALPSRHYSHLGGVPVAA